MHQTCLVCVFKINGDVIGAQIQAPSTIFTWVQFFTTWNSGSATTATITIINDNLGTGGNDFALDDITFSATCVVTDDVTVTVLPVLGGNTITCPQTTSSCLSLDPGVIAGSTPTGGNGSYAYQWEVSDDNISFSPIPGATSADYNPGVVYSTTYYRRKVTSGDCSSNSNVCSATITSQNAITNNTLSAPSPAAFCNSGDAGVISGSTPSGGGNSGNFVYIWESSTDNNNWNVIQGATSISYNPPAITQTTYYRRTVQRGSCSSIVSNVVTITINTPPVITVLPSDGNCGPGSFTLAVSGTGTITWYTQPQNGTSIATGATYTTPILNQTTNYYVQSTANGCTSDRVTVPAVINELPTITSTTDAFRCGSGNVTVSAAASSGTVNWYADAQGSILIGNGNDLTFAVNGNTTVFAGAESNGCSSAQTLPVNVTVGQNSTSEETQVACDSYTWNGTTYTTSGDYTFESLNNSGCTNTATLHLTINNSSTSEETQVACDSYTWNGTTYTTSGDYTFESLNNSGCTNTATLHLTINNSSTSEETQVACDSYTWNGTTYTTSGDYTFESLNNSGCTNTATLHLTINNSSTSEETQVACDSYTWNGTTYTTSGDYTFESLNNAGCTNTATLHLTINHSSTSEEWVISCGPYTRCGTTYTESGDYTYTSPNSSGCTNTALIHLTINHPTNTEETVVACGSYTWHGTTYTQSGDYTYQYAGPGGCNNIVTLHLTISQGTTSEETQVACDSYTWNGTTYTTSGDYTFESLNNSGCTNTATLHLTINQSTTSDETAVACNSYTWHGTTYNTSGNYTFQGTNEAGCSNIATLHLTINTIPSIGSITGPQSVCRNQSGIVYSVAPVNGATSYTWVLPNGITGSSSTNTISVSISNSFTSGIIKVRANNACGSSSFSQLSVSGIVQSPPTPGPISGPTDVCVGGTYTYSISPVSGATGYIWSVSGPGISIISGQGTTSIVVSTTTSLTCPTISVKASNCYGLSNARTITLQGKKAPLKPLCINGPSTVCKTQTRTYTVSSVNNAFSYTWTVTGGATFVGSSTGQTVQVKFNTATTTNVVLSVTANNACGSSPALSKNIYVNLGCRTMLQEDDEILTGNENVDVDVDMNEMSTEDFSLYPNPTDGNFKLLLNVQKAARYSFEITDMNGRLVYQSNEEYKQGPNIKEVALLNEKAGLYFVRIYQNGKAIKSMKVVLQ